MPSTDLASARARARQIDLRSALMGGVLLPSALLAAAHPAAAQSMTPPAPAADATPEVVVTSLRRPEALEDTPGSVTVFDSADLQAAGISSLRAIADRTPNFGMLDNYRPGLERFQVRGIITPQVGDPPLAFVIDGVTAPDPEFATQELFDVARVEILRGAQGALYGRSAVGGTVNITTSAPTNAVQGWVSGAYENGDTTRFSGVVSGPIVDDKLYFRIGGFRNDSDGLIQDTYLHTGADFFHDSGVSALLRAELGPRTTLDIHAQYNAGRDGIGYYDAVEPTQASIEDFNVKDSQNVLGVNRHESMYVSAKLEQGFDFATLTVAGGYFHTKDYGLADGDLVAVPADDATGFAPNWQRALDDLDAWTFEGRLTSLDKGPWTWALGAFYEQRQKLSTFAIYDDPSGVVPLTAANLTDPSLLESELEDNQHGQTWALSGETGYKFFDRLQVTVAGRYDHDYRQSYDPRDPAGTYAHATYDQFQPKVSLSYTLQPGVLIYGGYSRGFRSGGFNQYSPLVPREYPAETTDSYEAGFKIAALGNRVTVNGALFRNDQKNAQLTQFNSSSYTLENIAVDSVRSQGAELEATWRIMEGLKAELNGGYTQSRILAFKANPEDVGATMPYVPEFTSTSSLDYERPLSDGLRGFAHLDYRLLGPRSFTLDFPDLKSRAHAFVDLRMGVRHSQWTLTAYAENLFNEREPEDVFSVFYGPVDLARQPNHPRRFGVELRYDFGKPA